MDRMAGKKTPLLKKKSRRFPADLKGVQRARRHYQELIKDLELPEEVSFQIELALVEVWTNIVRHAYAGRSGEFRLTSWTEDDRLVFEVRDGGRPFDPRRFREPDPERLRNERTSGGFGCVLINRLMDEIDYRREGGENVLTLWKKRPPAGDASR